MSGKIPHWWATLKLFVHIVGRLTVSVQKDPIRSHGSTCAQQSIEKTISKGPNALNCLPTMFTSRAEPPWATTCQPTNLSLSPLQDSRRLALRARGCWKKSRPKNQRKRVLSPGLNAFRTDRWGCQKIKHQRPGLLVIISSRKNRKNEVLPWKPYEKTSEVYLLDPKRIYFSQ